MKWQTVLFINLLLFTACQKEENLAGWPQTLEVEVTGTNYEWQYLYPGPDGQLYTSDDISKLQDFRLPAHSNILILLKSSDFIYTFKLPDFSAKEMAIPGLTQKLELETNKKGTFTLKGDQMCGFTHESLFGKLKVLPTPQFQQWMND